jgi:glycerophosphoryl diester phosphodiesterase
VLIIAHRGASGHAPENTLAAYQRALQDGAGFIETDLHLTRDAQFVAIHDDALERTTNGSGRVQDWNLADLRKLDAGSWFSPQFAGERIPTLEEIFEFSRRHDMVFYLELKQKGSIGIEHALVSALRDSGEIRRVVVLSFDPRVLETMVRSEPMLMTGFLYEGMLENPFARAVSSGVRQIAAREDLITPAFLAQARQHDLQVVAWTVNDPARIHSLQEIGVAGIISDFPDRLLVETRNAASKKKVGR